jgi:N-terminal acetyltransferase B complex non-catalytic subunit
LQIPEFVSFEEQLENSLQRDLIKIEYVKQRLAHENVSSDVVDTELIELKFIFDRSKRSYRSCGVSTEIVLVHFDNRDTTVLPSFQPKHSPNLTAQTNLFSLHEGVSDYLKVFGVE